MGVAKSTFKVSGEPKSYTCIGGSGQRTTRHLCPVCGSLLFGTPGRAPDLVTIYAGSLDDLSLFRPQYVMYTRSRPAWDVIAGSLPEFATAPSAAADGGQVFARTLPELAAAPAPVGCTGSLDFGSRKTYLDPL